MLFTSDDEYIFIHLLIHYKGLLAGAVETM